MYPGAAPRSSWLDFPLGPFRVDKQNPGPDVAWRRRERKHFSTNAERLRIAPRAIGCDRFLCIVFYVPIACLGTNEMPDLPDHIILPTNPTGTPSSRDRIEMSRSLFQASFVFVLAVTLIGGLPGATLADDGWIELFNGRDLSGWHKNPKRIGHGTGGQWAVEDGVLVGQQDPPGSGNGGILLTDRTFGDFELMIDMKPDWGVCSGVFLRGNDQGQCYQMMVDYHDGGNVGHIYGEGVGGFNNRPFDIFGKVEDGRLISLTTRPRKNPPASVYNIAGPDWVKAWKVNDWNTARIRVVGNPPTITTWINGVKVTVFDATRYTQEGFDAEKVAATLGPAGRIAVQVHGGKGWPKGAKCRWKNIRIKPL